MTKLIFVYNADSGAMSLVKDYFHKILRPKTYACNLCMITYGNTGIEKKWAEFIKGAEFESEFLHKDEFHAAYPKMKSAPLPAVFIQGKEFITLIDSEEMASFKTSEDLIASLERKLFPKEK